MSQWWSRSVDSIRLCSPNAVHIYAKRIWKFGTDMKYLHIFTEQESARRYFAPERYVQRTHHRFRNEVTKQLALLHAELLL